MSMGLLPALLALISKSAGKILNTVFGWAVHALFGRASARQQTFLSGLVAAAVAWPVLLVGLAAPKFAALMLAFVPIPHWVPSWTVRLVWLFLAVLVPLAMGLAMTAHPPAGAPHCSALRRLARGFPITVGLAAAFLIMFISVPVMRIVALLKKQTSADVPLITTANAYHQVAGVAIEVLNQHGFILKAAEPGWWVAAPTRILGWFGGEAFRRFVPQRLEHYQSGTLVVSFYTSGVLLRGTQQGVTLAHGLIAELVPRTDGLQTTDASAQHTEAEIRRLWKVWEADTKAHTGSPILLQRLTEIVAVLSKLNVGFDDWQMLYRQLLQLERLVRGQPQLLESSARLGTTVSGREIMMSHKSADRNHEPRTPAGGTTAPASPDLSTVGTLQLVRQISGQVSVLAQKEIELAKTEIRADLQAELGMLKGVAISAFAALIAVNLLFVTGVLALAQTIPAWKAGLAVTAAVGLVAALVGLLAWGKRVRHPLERTRRTLSDDARWAKEELA